MSEAARELRAGLRRRSLTVEPCEAEHADLIGDVVPGSRRPQALELFLQLSPHQQHSVSHGLHVVLPVATQRDSHQKALRRTPVEEGFCASDHSANSSGEFSVMATSRAPWDGGLDQVVLTIFSIWDRILFRLSASRATTVRFPTRSSEGTNTFERPLQ